MTFETNAGTPAEHAQPIGGPSPGPDRAASPTPVQIRLQILTTEHWSLLASRGLAWNEVFARAGMYLSALSASIVALGLIGGIDHFGDAFFSFAFVLLPVVLFIGIGTWLRMGTSNYHDVRTIVGMNRIRGAYLEIAPDLEPYFVMGTHDDPQGIGITMALPPGTPVIAHLISSTPFLVVILNAVVAGALGALVLIRVIGASGAAAVIGASAVALLVLAFEMAGARRRIAQGQRAVRPMFPTPPDDPRDPVARQLL
jgi:hypothetical protein